MAMITDASRNYVLSFLFILGGAIGFATKGSLPSLLGGVTFGLLIGFAANMMQSRGKSLTGYRLATLGTFAGMAFMGFRFYKTGQVFPSGVFSAISGLNFVWNALQLNKLSK